MCLKEAVKRQIRGFQLFERSCSIIAELVMQKEKLNLVNVGSYYSDEWKPTINSHKQVAVGNKS